MDAIKIVSMPTGKAPRWVRKEWLGLVIPLTKISEEERKDLVSSDVLGGKVKRGDKNSNGYLVSTKIAVAILEEKNPTAAGWWRTESKAKLYLEFGVKFCDRIRYETILFF